MQQQVVCTLVDKSEHSVSTRTVIMNIWYFSYFMPVFITEGNSSAWFVCQYVVKQILFWIIFLKPKFCKNNICSRCAVSGFKILPNFHLLFQFSYFTLYFSYWTVLLHGLLHHIVEQFHQLHYLHHQKQLHPYFSVPHYLFPTTAIQVPVAAASSTFLLWCFATT